MHLNLLKVDESIFADDKLLLSSSYRISAIAKRLQLALSAHRRYFHRWKLKLNMKKTEAILFTKRRPNINVSIRYDDTEVCWLDFVKYLGIILDKKLNFGQHINYVVSKAIAKFINLYTLFKNKVLSQKSKIILYKSLVLPGMLYACPSWSFTCDSNISKLQVVQNKFLRIIGNCRKFTQISIVHKELNIEYVKSYIKKLSQSYFWRAKNHKNSLVRSIIYDKTSAVLKHKRIMHIV